MASTTKDIPALYRLRKLEDKESLASEVRRMAKRINQRFVRLEQAKISHESFSYRYAKDYLDVKDKPRYPESINTLLKLDITSLYQMALEIRSGLESNTTVAKLKKQIKKRDTESVATAKKIVRKASGDENIFSEDKWKTFLENDGDILLKYLDSSFIIEEFVEATKNNEVTPKQFLREWKRYADFTSEKIKEKLEAVDREQIKKNLVNVAKGNEKRRNKPKKGKKKKGKEQ